MSEMLAREWVSRTATGLDVRREDIRFWNESDDVVMIEITVRNEGAVVSTETRARIQVAPLGAFIPWCPLGAIPVPSIPAGGRVVVRARVKVQQLPGDPLRLVGHGGVHWAGNLNVFVNETPVERHRAKALRIHPGRLNAALFFVGSGRDFYSLDFQGDGTRWDPTLHEVSPAGLLRYQELGRPLRTGRWLQVRSQGLVLLAIRPPRGCGKGSLNVKVRQRSTGRSALVEFSLDESAKGPGCFLVGD